MKYVTKSVGFVPNVLNIGTDMIKGYGSSNIASFKQILAVVAV